VVHGPAPRTLAVAVAAVLLVPSAQGQTPDPARPPAELVQGNTAFALALYGRLREKPGNLFLSPYSLSTALAMTSAGARGETARQMKSALGLPDAAPHDAFRALRAAIASTPGIRTADGLFGQRGFAFLPEFLELAVTRYDARLEEVDFAGDT